MPEENAALKLAARNIAESLATIVSASSDVMNSTQTVSDCTRCVARCLMILTFHFYFRDAFTKRSRVCSTLELKLLMIWYVY